MVQLQHRKASLLYDMLMCSAAYFVCGVGGDCNNITQSLMRMAAAISHVNILCALQQLLSWHRLTRMFGDPSKASSSSPKSWVSSVVSNAFARNMEAPHTQTHTCTHSIYILFEKPCFCNTVVTINPSWSRSYRCFVFVFFLPPISFFFFFYMQLFSVGNWRAIGTDNVVCQGT